MTLLAHKSKMSFKLLSLLGILVAASCLWVATRLYPGGYDWNRDYISTLLRGPSTPARLPAVIGVFFFCGSMAWVFARLAHAVESSKNSKVIRIAGIGSMVYASLTVTPMHDLMVTISLIFLLVAILALIQALYVSREMGFVVTGCVYFVVLVASATIYYTGHFISVLPWAQRISFTLLAIWLVSLDFRLPHKRMRESEQVESSREA